VTLRVQQIKDTVSGQLDVAKVINKIEITHVLLLVLITTDALAMLPDI
jgi:hypothetical protein